MVEKQNILNSGIIPPQAIEIETSVLGAMLIDASGLEKGIELLNNDCFYDPKHRIIYKTIAWLFKSNEAVDMLTVCDRLEKTKELEKVGGAARIVAITQSVASSAHIEEWCRILLQKYLRRKMIGICNQGISKAYDESNDTFEFIESLLSKIERLNSIFESQRATETWHDAVLEIPKRVEFLTNNKGKITGLPTGFRVIDKHFSGWQKQDFIVLGADSGMGKTSLSVSFLLAPAKQGIPVGMFSLEMGIRQIATRSMAVESPFHLNQLTKTGFEKQEYFATLMEEVNTVKDYPIYIDDTPAMTVDQMKRKAKQMHRKHKIQFLLIDFIQMFEGQGKENLRVTIGEASRACKNIAKELDIVVMALSQVTRSEIIKNRFKIPNKHHLKEASAIEEAADVILLIYRPGFYGHQREQNANLYEDLGISEDDNAVLMVVKYRDGSTGNISMLFKENKTKFVDRKKEELTNAETPF